MKGRTTSTNLIIPFHKTINTADEKEYEERRFNILRKLNRQLVRKTRIYVCWGQRISDGVKPTQVQCKTYIVSQVKIKKLLRATTILP